MQTRSWARRQSRYGYKRLLLRKHEIGACPSIEHVPAMQTRRTFVHIYNMNKCNEVGGPVVRRAPQLLWRRVRDSNPSYAINVNTISNRAPSTAQPTLQTAYLLYPKKTGLSSLVCRFFRGKRKIIPHICGKFCKNLKNVAWDKKVCGQALVQNLIVEYNITRKKGDSL